MFKSIIFGALLGVAAAAGEWSRKGNGQRG
jgi:hypothetical protein